MLLSEKGSGAFQTRERRFSRIKNGIHFQPPRRPSYFPNHASRRLQLRDKHNIINSVSPACHLKISPCFIMNFPPSVVNLHQQFKITLLLTNYRVGLGHRTLKILNTLKTPGKFVLGLACHACHNGQTANVHEAITEQATTATIQCIKSINYRLVHPSAEGASRCSTDMLEEKMMRKLEGSSEELLV